jgi:hypothetical protein
MKIISNGLVCFKRFFPTIALNANELAVDPFAPFAEVVNSATDFLLPGAARVRREREFWIRLAGSVGGFTGPPFLSRITGHGAASIA